VPWFNHDPALIRVQKPVLLSPPAVSSRSGTDSGVTLRATAGLFALTSVDRLEVVDVAVRHAEVAIIVEVVAVDLVELRQVGLDHVALPSQLRSGAGIWLFRGPAVPPVVDCTWAPKSARIVKTDSVR